MKEEIKKVYCKDCTHCQKASVVRPHPSPDYNCGEVNNVKHTDSAYESITKYIKTIDEINQFNDCSHYKNIEYT